MNLESQFTQSLNRNTPGSFDVATKTAADGVSYESVEGEFWTAGQRQAKNIHEVSYRACFKPQLPKFFIDRFSREGDTVYDPFAGRGTTAIEAALSGRRVISNDVNPLSTYFTRPRLEIPSLEKIVTRLSLIPRIAKPYSDLDLEMFYEASTLSEIVAMKTYLKERELDGKSDATDRWIRMVATNRLTGHSPGFFSVYSMPPNQAVSQESQKRINTKRNQFPTYRDTHALILKKSKQLQKGLSSLDVVNLQRAAETAIFLNSDASTTPEIDDSSVQLTVTSPPFLDVVQYSEDNWLRGWFNSIDMEEISSRITMSKTVEQWNEKMLEVFVELFRITKPDGFVAFEVGEIRNGRIKLEDAVVPVGIAAGFRCSGVLINTQVFTKTSNIWGVSNNSKGTNSNRIVVFRK